MFVQLICKDRNEKEMNELYEVLAALCHREGIQIEDKGSHVEILACPQGKIVVTEEDGNMILSANTRHAGAGFHAFVVDLFKDIQEEVPLGEYELIDDLEYANDEDFHRLHHVYENELDYVKNLILTDSDFRKKNYLYDETYFLPIEDENKVMTSTGFMDRKEFMNKEIEDLMDDFYVWNDWDRDARFYRNAALTLLAKEGRGIYSKMNEETEKTANEIADYLEIAHEKDPDLKLPVKEYTELVDLLDRENKLKDALPMDREAIQYRTREVYHLFEDARVVAPGTAERSYDPSQQSVNLMAPYTNEGEWSWLIQASKQPAILPDAKDLMEEKPEIFKGKTIWMDTYEEDGIHNINAVIRQDEEYLYIHAITNNSKDVPYLQECIRLSGFAH
ncbi:hypothetical protein [Ileibacterium valens]|uniref:Uncharacterized protein n=1 Tax=Ileibacterium valens TaxID=1862668 RepID=A0A1U7NG77_9FIRM|nr:hypothetical protein [Ileibacterium valens]OLU38705.1 hypothetical protein BM735_08930 [Erysipelotrichaceae bacterium NYU-BL-F16]OLU39900.1 hypothetical protein BO222_05965 [Ileibacterium valens]OLU41504.1 hypothetical protein BO224_03350 [Erysipelotrichaceae bacterium NYU-BL-E8]